MDVDCNNRRCCGRCGCNMMNNYNMQNEALETVCDDVPAMGRINDSNSCNTCCMDSCNNDNCACGFNEEESYFPDNPMLAQSYVPIQYMTNTFTPCCGLKNGTIFPELVSSYYPGQSMNDIEYLRRRNEIGKGCNECL